MSWSSIAALLLAGTAGAQDPAAAAAPGREVVLAPASAFYPGTHLGLQLDAGVPSGAAVSLVGRPWKFLRLDAGLGYNAVAYGIKGGVTLVPFHWWLTPTLGFGAGHYAPADASRFASGSSAAARQILSRVGYDYLSADLGLEIGGQDRFVFFLRAGLANLYPTVKDVNGAMQAANPSVRMTAADPTIRARIPTVRLGFLVYLF
jgi:hypothetical protein